jgi:type II secretory pathway pseudopilin PulG
LSAGASRPFQLLRGERGFMLVEALVAMTVFAIVATGVVDMLVSSTSITTLARQRTLAEEGVSNQIEYIRSIDYPSLGNCTTQCVAPPYAAGNPSGPVRESQVFVGVNGEPLGVPATMTTDISYAGANVPGSAQTGADEKEVVVTITRTSDSQVLAQAVTYVAPKKQSSQTTGAVEATVTDIGNNQSQSGTVLEDVNVTLTPPVGLSPAIPSGPEADTTDASGTVSFPALTPTSGAQLYTVAIATADLPAFYTQLPVAGFQLSPTQIQPESIQVYQPVTLYVALLKVNGTAWVGNANITVTAGSGGTSYTFNNVPFTSAGTPYAITTLSPPNGQLLLPNIDYSISVQANGFSVATDDDVVPVAGTYPASAASTLTDTFTETMLPLTPPAGELDVTVQMTHNGNPITCQNATVVVSGGPNTASYLNYTLTPSASPWIAKFPNSTYPNIVANQAPYDTTPFTVQATTSGGATKTLSNVSVLPLSGGPTALPINVGNTTLSSC